MSEIRKTKKTSFSVVGIRLTAAVLVFFVLILLFSLYRIQVLEHADMSQAAAGQYYSMSFIEPARGDIYDCNGAKLAGSNYVYRVGITPRHVYSRVDLLSRDEIIAFMAETLGLKEDKIREELSKTDASYIQLVKDLPEDKGKALEEFVAKNQIGGVRLDAEARRYYLNDNLASQVIGFAGFGEEGKNGLFGRLGIELQYDSLLRGEEGFVYAARDNYLSHGYLPYSVAQKKESRDGADISLTLDLNIQKILQTDLEAAIKAYDAMEYGMGLVINPYTGAVLAMASYPYFRSDDPTAAPSGVDPAKWNLAEEGKMEWLMENVWSNKTISSTFEAGSTMKAITAAIGIEEGVTAEGAYYSDDPITVLDAEISCVSGDGHGTETMEEGFWRSCNPVFVQIALALGTEKFYDYIRAFGFYERSGIQLPGEAGCIFHNQPSALDLANLSFGESSSVTPVHLMRAFCALVNGGKLVTPHVIQEIRSANGKLLSAPGPEVTRQVISSETSARVRNLMKGMVAYTRIQNWGYSIGGKTSTSTDELTGYNTVSFVAAAPIEHPELLVVMILQRPSDVHVGGSEAQIVVTNSCSRILDYLNIDRRYGDEEAYAMSQTVELDNLVGLTLREAAAKLTYSGIPVVAGDNLTQGDSRIQSQIPSPGTILFRGSNVYVYAGEASRQETVLPDFSGMNYNECMNAANEAGIVPQFEGQLTGGCVSQKLVRADDLVEGSDGRPGSRVYRGALVKIALMGQ